MRPLFCHLWSLFQKQFCNSKRDLSCTCLIQCAQNRFGTHGCSEGLTVLWGLWETGGGGDTVVEKEGLCWHMLGQNPVLGNTHGWKELILMKAFKVRSTKPRLGQNVARQSSCASRVPLAWGNCGSGTFPSPGPVTAGKGAAGSSLLFLVP